MTSEQGFRQLVNGESGQPGASRFEAEPLGDVVADIKHNQTMGQVRELIAGLGADSVRYALLGSIETE